MKKIKVSTDACIGCGACVAIDSEHFEFNDEGLSHATNNNNLESEDLRNAIDSCPTSAISIVEENEDCHCNNNCDSEDNCECGCIDCNCTEESNCGCHSKEEN